MTTLTPAERRAEYLAAVPVSARGIVERAFACAASKRDAIKAKCLDCSHFDRAEIADCLVMLCPLWSYRPYQEAVKHPWNSPGERSCDETGSAGVPASPATLRDDFALTDEVSR